ncbi:MAG: stage III sporulation protein AD [Ruminococcaceae bacterium]|nr:stage III sporulation protein AD [Oscillospiraceae bacterium]
MDIFQLITLGLIGSLLALTVHSFRPELAVCVSLAVGLLIFSGILSDLGNILLHLLQIMEENGIRQEYILTVFKIIGISYLAQFAGELCKDCGQNAIAIKIELAGKVSILVLTLPILNAFLDLVVRALSFF